MQNCLCQDKKHFLERESDCLTKSARYLTKQKDNNYLKQNKNLYKHFKAIIKIW